MTRLNHIFIRLLLVAIPVLMAMAPAMAQNRVCAGQSTDLSVVEVPGDTYAWELYKEVGGVNFATTPGNCPPGEAYFTGLSTGPTVNVMWVTPGTYYFKVTAFRDGCTMNLKVGEMIVLPPPTATLQDPIPPICRGETASITVTLTGIAPWNITYTDGTTPVNITGIMTSPYQLQVSPAVTTNYKITTVTDAQCTSNVPSNTVTVTVKPKPETSPIWHN